MEKWDTADNIDLYMVMLEYEHSYEMKFNKPPKLVKKAENSNTYEQLKKAALKQKQINSSINSKQLDEPPKIPTKRKSVLMKQTSRKKTLLPLRKWKRRKKAVTSKFKEVQSYFLLYA